MKKELHNEIEMRLSEMRLSVAEKGRKKAEAMSLLQTDKVGYGSKEVKRHYEALSPLERLATLPERNVWVAMRQRCTNPNREDYCLYGGRGIMISSRWNYFTVFYADMGSKPSPTHTLERLDGNGHYEPGNCVWATLSQQNQNTRRNRFLTIDGITLCVTEWARRRGIPTYILHGRIARGMSGAEVLTKPYKKRRKRDGTYRSKT